MDRHLSYGRRQSGRRFKPDGYLATPANRSPMPRPLTPKGAIATRPGKLPCSMPQPSSRKPNGSLWSRQSFRSSAWFMPSSQPQANGRHRRKPLSTCPAAPSRQTWVQTPFAPIGASRTSSTPHATSHFAKMHRASTNIPAFLPECAALPTISCVIIKER